MAREESVHGGHRERMRKRFLDHGLDNFADHEVLELLLYYAIPRGDVNPTAHALLKEFGSLAAVLDADPMDLQKITGVGARASELLHLMPPLFRRYRLSESDAGVFDTTDKVGRYLVNYYIGHVNELLTVILLDNRCRMLSVQALEEGNPHSVKINYRALMNAVLRYNAVSVILAHNHPNGTCVPSREDFIETRMVRDFLQKVGVKLVDHIVVAGTEWTSVSGYT